MESLYDLLTGSSRARENERRRISSAFPEIPLARGGYRPPPVTLRRPRVAPLKSDIDIAEEGIKKYRESLIGKTPVVKTPSIFPFARERGITTEENMPKEPVGSAEWQAKMTPREPSPAPTADVENSRFLRMPVSKAEFNLEPGTPTPKEKLGFLEGMDEDTRRNLMLSALTTGLKLMSSQRWSTTPQSPVADIGEAGLTGVQTYVGLTSADRKYKLLEAERRRKELRDLLTGRHQGVLERQGEEKLGYMRPGGVQARNIESQIESREPFKEVTTPIPETGGEIKEFKKKSELGALGQRIFLPDTVAVEEYNKETGDTYTKRISKKEQGEFLKKPGGVIKEITDQAGNTKLVKIIPGPAGKDISVTIPGTEGTSAQVIAARERAKATDYKEKREFLDRKVKNILASANIEMTAEEAVKFDLKKMSGVDAFFASQASKGKVLSAPEKARIKKELKDAWDDFESAVAPRIGSQAEKKKTPIPVDFDLTFK